MDEQPETSVGVLGVPEAFMEYGGQQFIIVARETSYFLTNTAKDGYNVLVKFKDNKFHMYGVDRGCPHQDNQDECPWCEDKPVEIMLTFRAVDRIAAFSRFRETVEIYMAHLDNADN